MYICNRLRKSKTLEYIKKILLCFFYIRNKNIEKLIKINLPKGHNYEVAWALWMCVEFNIKLKNKMAQEIFSSNDILSILIALDLKSRNLINTSVSTNSLLGELTTDSLMNENWLFTYEAINNWESQPYRAYLFLFFVVLAIFMFFFKRNFRKKMEERNK